MFIIIDGSSLLSTSYYGNLPREVMMAKTEEEKESNYDKILHAKDGTFTNAIYTMSKMLLKIKNEQNPSHIVVAFDKTRETFRRFMYPEYKAQRGATPRPLKEQFVLMENILEKSGFTTLYSDSIEADDYAGSVAEKFKGRLPIRLITKDHDYMQLVDDNKDVKLWLLVNSKEAMTKLVSLCGDAQESLCKPDRAYECGVSEVTRIEGVLPCQIPEKKGMCGDASDNIPGIKGVSDKTAIPLLNKFTTLDNILYVMDNVSPDNFAQRVKDLGIKRNPAKLLEEGRERGRLSVDLATIRRHEDVPDDLDTYDTKNIKWDTFLDELRNLDIRI